MSKIQNDRLPDRGQSNPLAEQPDRGSNVDFDGLMRLAVAGDQMAINTLVDRYGKHVKRAVRRMLPHRMRSLYDSDDFEQAVWKSFLIDQDAISRMTDPARLIAHLATLARNKVIDESRRRMGTQKHDMRRERRTDWDSDGAPVDARQPTPSDVAIGDEVLQMLVDSASPTSKKILELRLAGCTSREIGAAIGMHERAVRRALAEMARLVRN